ncbi:MAG: glycosyltransferase family 39 protein [Bacteroidales bacterium]|nr:glycosyltransferase family 39 protein [Bacteroidales bacterium]
MERTALLIILFLAAVLRFWHYSDFSLSNDELSALNRLRFDTFSELVKGGFYVDGHPGGIQVFLWYWVKLFGNTEASIRFPFVVFGILAVYMSYLVAGKMFGRVAGLFTAASLAFLQFPLTYSQIARPYGSGLLFSLMMVYFWLNIISFKNDGQYENRDVRLKDWVGFTISLSLCMYNHYFSFLLALVAGLLGLFLIDRKRMPKYLLCGFAAVLLFIPHIGITLNHLSYEGVGLWLGKPGIEWPLNHIEFVFNDSFYMILLFLVVSVIISNRSVQPPSNQGMFFIALILFLAPMIIGFFYSYFVNPVLQHPVLIFSFPFLVMMLFMAGGNEFGKIQQSTLAIFLFLGITVTVGVNKYYHSQHFGEFKEIASTSLKWEQEFNQDSIQKIIVVNSPWYLKYYFERLGQETKYDYCAIGEEQDFKAIDSIARLRNKPYLLFAWTKLVASGVEDRIRANYPGIVKSIQFGKLSGITLFSLKQGAEFRKGQNFTILSQATADTSSIQHMDSLKEYSGAVEMNLDEYISTKAIHIVAEVNVFCKDSLPAALLALSADAGEKNQIIWTATPIDEVCSPNIWQTIRLTADLTGKQCEGARLKVYVWNKGKRSFEYSRLKVRIYRYENHSPFNSSQEIWGDLNSEE